MGFRNPIVTSNIQVADKIHILRTALSISSAGMADITELDEILKAIADYKWKRNMIAHTPFGPMEVSDGVSFMRKSQAKGTISYPEEEWTFEDFKRERAQLAKWRTTELKN